MTNLLDDLAKYSRLSKKGDEWNANACALEIMRTHAAEIERNARKIDALMQALEAWGKHPGYQGGESWVMKRADELMRGGGK